MTRISFVKEFENKSQFNEDGIFLITSHISFYTRGCLDEDLPGNLYILSCDMDRIYLSANPEATPESPADYIIRTWDYHICEDDPERVHMDWTFHVLKECPDGSGSSSAEQLDGDGDILVFGEVARMRVAVLKGLSVIHLPDYLTVIPKDAFIGCTELKEVHIPEGVIAIETDAFAYCESLSIIDLPDSMTKIGILAFYGCTSLQKIHIPDNVIHIDRNAFECCYSLTEISIPILNISETGLREDTHVILRTNGGERSIPDGITSIPAETFANCSELKTIQIPNTVTRIGWSAFRGCTGLQEAFIPDSVMSIGGAAFKDCNNLTELSVPLGLNIASAGLEESTEVVVRDSAGIRVLPEGVTEIPESAFEGCTELKGIEIPDSVTAIGEYAFKSCTALSEIHIPANVTSIANNAFMGCTNLSKISVSSENRVYDSRDSCNAIIETETGRVIADCKETILPDSWFQSICDIYGFTGSDEPDEEIRVLTILKDNFVIDDEDDDEMLDAAIKRYIASKYRKDWYKNYLGTRKILFDGPADFLEEDLLTEEHIKGFMEDHYMVEFADYRLKTGHTERQDKFVQFIHDCPIELLEWLDDSIPYGFFTRIAQGGDYELFGHSKKRFLYECGGDLSDMQFEYAAVLEEKYGIGFAVDYLNELGWAWNYTGQGENTVAFNLSLLSKAVELEDNEMALRGVAYYSICLDVLIFSEALSFKKNIDRSIEMYSRLASMWKKGLISDDWLTDDLDTGLAAVFDFEWGDDYWEEDSYPEHPDEDDCRIWLLKLLESDFAEDIADYLKPLLEMVLEKEKNHNWETGKRAIEAFLEKTAKN